MNIIIIISWLLLGLGGYFITIHAYKMLEGFENPIRKKQQLPVILIGPIGVLFGLFALWDIYTDPPKH